jgi:hypothetical protein
MSKYGLYKESLSIGAEGIVVPTVQETGNHQEGFKISLPAGESGTLSTRTDDGEGVLTITSHSVEVGDEIDIYWTDPDNSYATKARYGVTVDSVDTNTITFDNSPAASGDALPTVDTAIVASVRVEIAAYIDGDNVRMFGLTCDQVSQCSFYDSGSALVKQYEIDYANQFHVWWVSSGITNPLTGNMIYTAEASNGTTTAATLNILILDDPDYYT